MSVSKPFRRTVRPFTDGAYGRGGDWRYIEDPRFATDPEHYIRAFGVIQNDLIELFDYIEPSDTNRRCYSFRVHELFMRACVELEANFKAILAENGFCTGRKQLNMAHYKKCENSHRLSSYEIKFPAWHGSRHTRRPFSGWAKPNASLRWYQDYHDAKHSRHSNFGKANFSNLLDSVAGLLALLSAQFWTRDFSPSDYLSVGRSSDGSRMPGGYFRVKFPNKWPARERYDFDWATLQTDPDPFQSYPY